MSIDLELRCKQSPSLEEIEKVIFPLGWEKYENAHGSKEPSYLWFHKENYESIRGCWLFINEPDGDAPPNTKLVFEAQSKAGRSFEDLEAQNLVIKTLRKNFGGTIYNPQEGNRSYIFNDLPRLTPAEKACGFVYIGFQDNISRAVSIVEDIPQNLDNGDEFMQWRSTFDKSLLRNNTTLPFLVSCLESFLKEFLTVYIKTHPDVQEKIYEKTTKLEYKQLKDLMNGKKSLAEVEVENYTFQNLYSANSAYKTYTGIDIFEVLNKRKRVGSSRKIVRDVITEMLELRHKIIHSAYIDVKLSKERMQIYIGYLRATGQLFVNKFLTEKNFRIDLEEYV